MNWEFFWQIAGPVVGGIVAAGAGLGAYLVARARTKSRERKEGMQRLRSFLVIYENELSANIGLIGRQLTDNTGFLEYLPIQGHDTIAHTIGSIPYSQATDAVRYVVESYAIIDELNQITARIESQIEHEGDARQLIAQRREFAEGKLPILKWDHDQLVKIREAIKSRIAGSDLS